MAWWLVDMCIINAHTRYCVKTNTIVSQLHFELMDQLWAACSHAATAQQQAGPPYHPSIQHWPLAEPLA